MQSARARPRTRAQHPPPRASLPRTSGRLSTQASRAVAAAAALRRTPVLQGTPAARWAWAPEGASPQLHSLPTGFSSLAPGGTAESRDAPSRDGAATVLPSPRIGTTPRVLSRGRLLENLGGSRRRRETVIFLEVPGRHTGKPTYAQVRSRGNSFPLCSSRRARGPTFETH